MDGSLPRECSRRRPRGHHGRAAPHRCPRAPYAAAAPARRGAGRRCRRTVAQARTPATRRQLQGARHVQPHAVAADPGRRRRRRLRRQRRHRGGGGGTRARVPCEVFLPELASPAKRQVLADLGPRCSCTVRPTPTRWRPACNASRRPARCSCTPTTRPRSWPAPARWRPRSRTRPGLPDRVLVSVGGGGLVAGIAAWFAGRTRVEALEPRGAPTLHAALAAGEPVDVAVSGLAADAWARGASAPLPGRSASASSPPRTWSTMRPSAPRSASSGLICAGRRAGRGIAAGCAGLGHCPAFAT